MLPDLRRLAAGACVAVLTALAPQVPPAQAQESLVQESISEDAAVALVRGRTDGKVVRVDRRVEGTKLVYLVRVLSPDGRLREYRVDAGTGSVR